MLEVKIIETLLSVDSEDGICSVIVGSPAEEKVDRGSEVALRTAPELRIAMAVSVDMAADGIISLDEPAGERS